MSTSTFELVMGLKCNRALWDERLVYKCRTNPRRRPAPVALPAVIEAGVNAIAPAVNAPVMNAPAVNAAVAAAELAAFIDDLDAELMGNHQNAFLRAGIEAALEESDGEEDREEEEEEEGDDSDFSDEEFADDEFAEV